MSPYLEPHQWVAIVSYRYFHSFRDFQGDHEVHIPLVANDTYIDVFDLSITYALTKRLSFSWEIPFQYGSRTNKVEHDLIHVHTMRAAGMGDWRFTGNYLLLDPDKYPNQNITLGLGLKVPTGEDAATDYSYRATGAVLRPVDSAIQPGDGGWGIIFSGHAFTSLSFAGLPFTSVFKNTFAYLDATYLVNPQEFSSTQTEYGDIPDFTAGDRGEMFNSVPDQFVMRAGITGPVWPDQGIAGTLGVRWEGIPSHDLIGGSDGYRVPGYSVSIEPGLSMTRGPHSIGITTPVAFYRKGLPAVPDVRIHSPFAGIASFADFQINVTYSFVF